MGKLEYIEVKKDKDSLNEHYSEATKVAKSYLNMPKKIPQVKIITSYGIENLEYQINDFIKDLGVYDLGQIVMFSSEKYSANHVLISYRKEVKGDEQCQITKPKEI